MAQPGRCLKWQRARCESGACVEFAHDGGYTAIRDSAVPDGTVLWFPAAAWAEFLTAVRSGELDLKPAPEDRHVPASGMGSPFQLGSPLPIPDIGR